MKDLFKLYFDEGWNFDDNLHFDADYANEVSVLSEVDADFYEILDNQIEVVVRSDFDVEIDYIKAIDILPLVPEKYHTSELLKQYIEVANVVVGSWLGKIDDLVKIINLEEVDRDYLRRLAQLIGLNLIIGEETTDDEIRNQIRQAVDWYKKKGTYDALRIVTLRNQYNLRFYDMYTNDYSNFVEVEDWFVGDEGENPPGLDSSYYKSPHIGIELVLDKLYGYGESSTPYGYLFKEDMSTNIVALIEQARPVNVVPHYRILLEAITYENGQVYETSVKVKTTVTENWNYSRLYFDQQIESSGAGWRFDDGKFFDQAESSFLNSVTKWKLGTGNKGKSPDESDFTLENVVLSGDIDSVDIGADTVVYTLDVPVGDVQSGLSELGLFLNDGSTMVVASTFPDIDKVSGVGLRIKVIIRR